MYQRIVVPLDGSDLAEKALVDAENMAVLTHAPIHLIRVIDLTDQDTYAVYGMMADPTTVSYLLSDEAASATQYLESVARRIADQGHRMTSEVRHGSVANELIAASRSGDLYVIASHGRSGIARWFMGSVAEEVVRRSSVPVLLIRAASNTGRQPGQSLVGAVTDAPPMEAAVSW